MPNMIWLGLDVHAATIAVARYDDDSREGLHLTVPNSPAAVRRLASRIPTRQRRAPTSRGSPRPGWTS